MRSLGIAVALLCCAEIAIGAPAKPPAKQTQAKSTRPSSKRVVKKRWRPASGRSRFAAPPDSTSSPAYRYANMSAQDCESELIARKVPYVRERNEGTRGVDMPIRFTGPLHGVEFRTNLSAKQRADTPWEIADCRLALALDDFAEILQAHDIVEVRHYSMHRLVQKSWSEGQATKQHMAGRAIDAARFIARDGSYLDVDKDFHGAIGATTCGDKAAPRPATPEAVKLREILCEAVSRKLFNIVLTPNYNRPHKNHFHLEVAADVKWFLVH